MTVHNELTLSQDPTANRLGFVGWNASDEIESFNRLNSKSPVAADTSSSERVSQGRIILVIPCQLTCRHGAV